MAPAATKKRKQPRPKHVPQRMCVVCRETGDKRNLTRIVRTSETSFAVDPTGRANGRGAYVCDNPACRTALLQSTVLARALRVTPDTESMDRLREFAAVTIDDPTVDGTSANSKEEAE